MGVALAKSSGRDTSDVTIVDAEVSTTKRVNNDVDVVMNKIASSKQFQVKLGYNVAKMKHFAKQISDVEELKKSYLSTDWLHTIELYRTSSDVDNNNNNNNTNNNNTSGLSTTFKSTETDDLFNNLMNIEDEDDQDRRITEKELDNLKNQKFAEKIRIKLLIAETADTSSKRALRQLISPVLNTFNVLPELGMFHSALIIGPWKLEFNDSGVVVPRKIISSAAVLTADIDHITTVNRFNDITNKLAQVIVKWNTQMQYKENGGDKSKVGNCQDFVDDVLAALDIKLNFSGPLQKFVDRLRKTGKCTLQFEPDVQFIERFELHDKIYKFTDHHSLDSFVQSLIHKNPNIMTDHRSEWALLKSFDRAFWLKHMKFPDRQEYCPLSETNTNTTTTMTNTTNALLHLEQKPSTCQCPFGDPNQYSFLGV